MKLNIEQWGMVWLGTVVALCACFGQKSMAASAPAHNTQEPTLSEIVDRLVQTQQESHEEARSYTVLRNYELLSGKKPEASSHVTAEVSYSPPGTKVYAIRATSGNGGGERVIRRVLDHEAEMASSWRDVALTQENYNFQLLGKEKVDGHNCYVLGLTPRRDRKDLIRGRAWIDTESFNVRRIEGAPLKSPSWWVKRLEITMQFSQVMGIWLQTAFVAKADVRFFGEHTLKAYDVQLHTPEIAGKGDVSQTDFQDRFNDAGSSPAMVGAGVFSMPWRQQH